MNKKPSVSGELFHFIRENANDHYALQVILFFADHPYARFNEPAIIHASNLNGGRIFLQKALKNLVAKGTVKACVYNNGALYSLDENNATPILELAKLDMHQRQVLVAQAYSDSSFQHRVAKVFSDITGNIGASGRSSLLLGEAGSEPDHKPVGECCCIQPA